MALRRVVWRVGLGLVELVLVSPSELWILVVGRVCSVRQATVQQAREMKPIIRIVQGKPMMGARYSVIRVNMIPPIPPAVQAMPVARPCRLENQCPIVETLGVKRKHAERPPRTPKDSRN